MCVEVLCCRVCGDGLDLITNADGVEVSPETVARHRDCFHRVAVELAEVCSTGGFRTHPVA